VIADSFDNSSSLRSTRKCAVVPTLRFGLTCLLQTKRLGAMAKLIIVLIISTTIVHSRSLAGISAFKIPHISDILTNTLDS